MWLTLLCELIAIRVELVKHDGSTILSFYHWTLQSESDIAVNSAVHRIAPFVTPSRIPFAIFRRAYLRKYALYLGYRTIDFVKSAVNFVRAIKFEQRFACERSLVLNVRLTGRKMQIAAHALCKHRIATKIINSQLRTVVSYGGLIVCENERSISPFTFLVHPNS